MESIENQFRKPYLKIFTSTLSLSALTFGGGYVMIPLMKTKFSDELGWIEEDEMLEFVAISQSTPGAMAINCSVLVGYRVAGLPGALCSLFGTTLPPLVILSIVSFFYELIRDNTYVDAIMTGMQSGIAAVIAEVVFSLVKGHYKKPVSIAIMLLAFISAWFFGLNAAMIIAFCALFGASSALIKQKNGGVN